MLKYKHIITSIAASALLWTACSDSKGSDTSFDYASTQITAFNLQANRDILPNLDSVFFSIDLVGARIFNADSLPMGTKTDKLQVAISTDNCSAVELHIPRPGQSDSIMNYLTNSTDSIDFSNGPVKLHVVSLDKVASRDYLIYVNVHKMINDSLQWDIPSALKIPGAGTGSTKSKTVFYNNRYLTLATDGTNSPTLYSANHPEESAEATPLSLTFIPRAETFTAATGTLYILASDGILYSSSDGIQWMSTGEKWNSITATYSSKALGTAYDASGRLCYATYPGTLGKAVDPKFPLGGTSQSFSYTSKWSTSPQLIITGGHDANDKALGGTWAYDGNEWGLISERLEPADGITLTPYYCTQTDSTTWVVTDRSVLLAFGGLDTDGKPRGSVYISYDLGFNWALAPAHMQLPAVFPALQGSDAFIINQVNHSRAIRPITEWDTPYIYLYEGQSADGTQGDGILRGVVNHLMFKPIQ